jgi:hypothetical protein
MEKQIKALEKKLPTKQVKNKFALANKIKKLKQKERQNNWQSFLSQ